MLNISGVQFEVIDESSEIEEILQNVNTILTTLEGSVPFDRDFGLSAELLDLPINEAESLYVVEVVTKVRKYEPRVAVEHVNFRGDAEGKLIPRVVLRIEA